MVLPQLSFPIGLIAFAAICSLLFFCLVSAVVTVLFHRFHDVSSTAEHPTSAPPLLVHVRSAARRKPTISALLARTTMLAAGPVHPAAQASNLSSDATPRLPKPSRSGDLTPLGSWRATWNRTRMGLLGVTFREFIESSGSSIFGLGALPSSGDVLEKLNGKNDRDVDDLEAGRAGISTADSYDDTPFLSYIRLAPNLFKAMEEDEDEELPHSKHIKHVPLGPLEFIAEEDEGPVSR